MMLDVSDRVVVIVGGGEVAVRKAQGLLAAGAGHVRIVAPVFHAKMPSAVQRIAETYAPHHLHDAGLVFAATDDPGVNDAVVRDSRQMGLLVCRCDADEENPGDFSTPALLRRGPVTVTVSTAGAPALAALVRDGIAARLDERWIQMAEAMQLLRPRVLARPGLDVRRRREIFRALATVEAMEALAAGGVEAMWPWLGERFPELRNV